MTTGRINQIASITAPSTPRCRYKRTHNAAHSLPATRAAHRATAGSSAAPSSECFTTKLFVCLHLRILSNASRTRSADGQRTLAESRCLGERTSLSASWPAATTTFNVLAPAELAFAFTNSYRHRLSVQPSLHCCRGQKQPLHGTSKSTSHRYLSQTPTGIS